MWFIPVIIGFVAGVSNVIANWDNIDGFWQGVAAFGVGVGAGAAACFTGGQSFLVVAGVAAGSGAVAGATNNVIAQTGKNFEGFNEVDWEDVGKSSAIGGVAGFAGGSAGYWATNASFTVNHINSPILRSALVSPLAAGSAHVAGNTTSNLFDGQNFGEALSNSFSGIGQSMVIGGAIGVGTTTALSLASGVNPVNGNKFSLKFASGAQRANNNPDRRVNSDILRNTIETGISLPDPQGTNAKAYYSQQNINGKIYNIKVIYNPYTNTVYHYHYQSKPFYNPNSEIILPKP